MKNNLKIIFLGTPEFAAIILEKVIQLELTPEAVVCNPDKPTGRKQIITPPPVKVLAQKYGLPIYQPQNKTELLEIIKKFQPDLAIVAAFGMIFTKEVLEIPKYGFINIHPSLLPKYRGATPIQTAILNGDEKTGVSLFLIDEEMDHGKIVSNEKLEMRNENYETLSKKLAELGAELLIKTLPDFVAGKITPLPQNEVEATYTKKIKTEDAFIDLAALQLAMQGEPRPDGREKAIEIDRKIRALNPEPGVFTLSLSKGGPRRTKLLEAELTADNKLKLKKIQFEGKNPMAYN